MYSLSYPDMFTSARTKLISDHEATASNLRLLLGSHKTGLLGDPQFGTKLKSYLFNQNNVILQDLIIDDIYVAICTYMPQLQLTRNNIKVEIPNDDKITVKVTINCLNKINYTINTYEVQLLGDD